MYEIHDNTDTLKISLETQLENDFPELDHWDMEDFVDLVQIQN